DDQDSSYPDNDLTYLTFLAGVWHILQCVRTRRRNPRSTPPSLFLPAVPLLQDLSPAVDLDVLAATWARHCSEDAHPPSLLDAAVLFGSVDVAAPMIREDRDWVRSALRQGVRQPDLRLDAWTAQRLSLQLTRWWPGLDYEAFLELADLAKVAEAQRPPLAE